MDLKEDVKEAKERLKAWWDHEIIDRPAVAYYYQDKRSLSGSFVDLYGENWFLAENLDDIEKGLDDKRIERINDKRPYILYLEDFSN